MSQPVEIDASIGAEREDESVLTTPTTQFHGGEQEVGTVDTVASQHEHLIGTAEKPRDDKLDGNLDDAALPPPSVVSDTALSKLDEQQIVTCRDLQRLRSLLPRTVLDEGEAIDMLQNAPTATDAYTAFLRKRNDNADLEDELRKRRMAIEEDLVVLDVFRVDESSRADLERVNESMQQLEMALRSRRIHLDGDLAIPLDSRGLAVPRRARCIPKLTKVPSADYSKGATPLLDMDTALECFECRPRGEKHDSRQFMRSGTVTKTTKSQQVLANIEISEKSQEMPEVLRIRSNTITRLLMQAVHEVYDTTEHGLPLELLRPYKLLLYGETEIRAKLNDLREKMIEKEAYMALCLRIHLSEQAEAATAQLRIGMADARQQTDDGQLHQPERIAEEAKFSGQDNGVAPLPRDQYYEAGPCPYYDSELYTDDCNLESLTYPDLAEAYNEFALLVKFMDEHVLPRRNAVQQSSKSFYFSDLWHVFEPGQLMYIKDSYAGQQIWQILHCNGGRRLYDSKEYELSNLAIDCVHLDYDGRKWQVIPRRFQISPYTGTQQATDLAFLRFDTAVAEGLVSRGSLLAAGLEFMNCVDDRHRYYSGRSIDTDPLGIRLERSNPDDLGMTHVYSKNIESQVIVDFERALQINPNWRPVPYTKDELYVRADDGEVFGEDGGSIEDDRKWDTRLRQDVMEPLDKLWAAWDRGTARPEGDSLLTLTNRVFAYVLRDREWACLRCSGSAFRKVEKKEDAWNDLMIPAEHKLIVQSLIEARFSQGQSSSNDFDLIRDKGKGLIVLLHGAPGVGKTSTAECVAEYYGKPLLPITCGDLGLTAERVEAKLQESFQLAQAWECVLLLDEADVFLASRTVEDIRRNALVSVFLRVLEYYEGILFLTTNRVGSFDEAFKSRIHMSLHYKSLDWNQTEKIWLSQIKRAKTHLPPVCCDENSLLAFAQNQFNSQSAQRDVYGPVWNGRQIRNAFQSAIAMAKRDASKRAGLTDGTLQQSSQGPIEVADHHFQRVARVADAFNDYLFQLKRNHNDSYWAKHTMQRNDEYDMQAPTDPYTRQANRTPLPGQYGSSFPSANVMSGMGQNMNARPQYVTSMGPPPSVQPQQYGNPQFSNVQPQQYSSNTPQQQYASMQQASQSYYDNVRSQQQGHFNNMMQPQQAQSGPQQSPMKQNVQDERSNSVFDPPQRTYSYADQQQVGGAPFPQNYSNQM